MVLLLPSRGRTPHVTKGKLMAKVQRQLPHPTEIFDLIKFKKLDLNLKRARLSDAQTIDDLRRSPSVAPQRPLLTTRMVPPTTKSR